MGIVSYAARKTKHLIIKLIGVGEIQWGTVGGEGGGSSPPPFPPPPLPLFFCFFVFFCHAYLYFLPASGQAVVTGVIPSSPPDSCLFFNFYRAYRVQSNPTARRFFIESFANSRSRSRFPLASQFVCTRKIPHTNLYEHAFGGIRTNETDLLYQALEDINLIRHRGDRNTLLS